MVRTQVQLSEEQLSALQKRAAQRHMSVAALVREAVDLALRSEERNQRLELALAVTGRFRSGHADISEEHDRYLDQGYRS